MTYEAGILEAGKDLWWQLSGIDAFLRVSHLATDPSTELNSFSLYSQLMPEIKSQSSQVGDADGKLR